MGKPRFKKGDFVMWFNEEFNFVESYSYILDVYDDKFEEFDYHLFEGIGLTRHIMTFEEMEITMDSRMLSMKIVDPIEREILELFPPLVIAQYRMDNESSDSR